MTRRNVKTASFYPFHSCKAGRSYFQAAGLPVCIGTFEPGYQVLRVYCIRYEIDFEELKHYSGVFRRKHENIENYRIIDHRIGRPMVYSMFGLGR